MKRGDVYDARLEPKEGSEQGPIRPVIIVSRDVINTNSPVVLAVPCTTYRNTKRIFETQVLIKAQMEGLIMIRLLWQIRFVFCQNLVYYVHVEVFLMK